MTETHRKHCCDNGLPWMFECDATKEYTYASCLICGETKTNRTIGGTVESFVREHNLGPCKKDFESVRSLYGFVEGVGPTAAPMAIQLMTRPTSEAMEECYRVFNFTNEETTLPIDQQLAMMCAKHISIPKAVSDSHFSKAEVDYIRATELPTTNIVEIATVVPAKKDKTKVEEVPAVVASAAPPSSPDDKSDEESAPLHVRRKNIPKHVKTMVWNLHMGVSNLEAKCFSCQAEKVDARNFQCGHVIAEAKGGDLTIKNLRPICLPCNASMGTCSMNEFTKMYFGREV